MKILIIIPRFLPMVGGAERQTLHAWARRGDLLDVGDAAGGLEDGVHEDRAGEPGLGPKEDEWKIAVALVPALCATDICQLPLKQFGFEPEKVRAVGARGE